MDIVDMVDMDMVDMDMVDMDMEVKSLEGLGSEEEGLGGWRDQRWFQAIFGPPPQCSMETYN